MLQARHIVRSQKYFYCESQSQSESHTIGHYTIIQLNFIEFHMYIMPTLTHAVYAYTECGNVFQ